ncbi:MAG: YkvA family protein [Candidatus Hermodarchaeota archaeon]
MLEGFKNKVKDLKRESYALYLAYRDRRVPRWSRFFLAIVIGYAFCPIDLIPDFIPILGYLDDLVLVPLGIYIALKLIPSEIMEECRNRAEEESERDIPLGKKVAIIILLLWIIGIIIGILLLMSFVETFFNL